VFESHLLTEDWHREGRAPFAAFLEFWSEWPEYEGSHLVLACLVVTYRRGQGMTWLRRLAIRRANERLRTFLRGLAFPTAVGTHGLVLDELLGVTRTDVEYWTREAWTRHFCRDQGHRLLEEVRMLHDREAARSGPEGRVAMQRMASELEKLLGRIVTAS
jgi:hypothetical protein